MEPNKPASVTSRSTAWRNTMRALVETTVFLAMPLLITAATAPAANGAQSATFASQTYPFLGNTHVVADLNGDSALDLVGTGANSVAVMLNLGSGTFGPKVNFPVGGPSQDAAAADFNGDGKMDLAVTINSS